MLLARGKCNNCVYFDLVEWVVVVLAAGVSPFGSHAGGSYSLVTESNFPGGGGDSAYGQGFYEGSPGHRIDHNLLSSHHRHT